MVLIADVPGKTLKKYKIKKINSKILGKVQRGCSVLNLAKNSRSILKDKYNPDFE